MFAKPFIVAAFLFSALVAVDASPIAGQDVPITDAEWAALNLDGLSRRNVDLRVRAQDIPITDAEWAALDVDGLNRRGGDLQVRAQNSAITNAEWTALEADGLVPGSASLRARDEVKNCGKNVLSNEQIGGHKVGWVPRLNFAIAANKFCLSYAGTTVSYGHETSDTYPTFLTNQTYPASLGAPGAITFGIFNTAVKSGWIVDMKSCEDAMMAPLWTYVLKAHRDKKGNYDGKGDQCYGGLHDDYEGGYYFVKDKGTFGSEVRKIAV